METGSKTYPPKGKVTLESSMRTPTEERRMMRILDGSLAEFRGRLSEMNSRLTKVEDEIWAKETGFTLPSYVVRRTIPRKAMINHEQMENIFYSKGLVHSQVLIKFQIGKYHDVVPCDVIPMQASHVLLGRPWQHSHASIHDGRHNTYTVMSIGCKYVLKPMSPSQVIELYRKMDELRDKRKKKEGHVEAEAQGEGEKMKLKGKAKLVLAEHKEIREDVGVESALILKDHELQPNPSHYSLPHSISLLLQDPREALLMDTFVGCPNIPTGVSFEGKEDLSSGNQGRIAKLNTFSITNEQSVNVNLSLSEPIDSVPYIDNVLVESVDTLVDPIDDRIDSSSKIDLCPPSVDTDALNASSLFCNECVDQPIYECNSLVEVSCNVITEPQFGGTDKNVDHLIKSDSLSMSFMADPIACFTHRDHVLEGASKYDMCLFEGELACFTSSLVVDYSLFKYNILFEDVEITPSDIPSGVNHKGSIVLDNYTCYNNLLWCEAFPPKMEISS
ncbi:hypothetical protein KY285_006370 [Solanum tuberosum]|nr:hypothetical protein KY285_006370 [Solanum tuberosum]